MGQLTDDLQLFYDDVYGLPTAERIEYARRAEKAAMDADPRIKNSEGGSFDAASGRKVLANSHGFVGEYRRSYCSVSAVPIAQDENGGMQRDYWYSSSRDWHDLEKVHTHVVEAMREMDRARAANHYDMDGHGAKAEQLLRRAERELHEAVEAARAAK